MMLLAPLALDTVQKKKKKEKKTPSSSANRKHMKKKKKKKKERREETYIFIVGIRASCPSDVWLSQTQEATLNPFALDHGFFTAARNFYISTFVPFSKVR